MDGTVVKVVTGYGNGWGSGSGSIACSSTCTAHYDMIRLKSACGDPDNPKKDFFIEYAHVSKVATGIKIGRVVKKGQLIPYVGANGRSWRRRSRGASGRLAPRPVAAVGLRSVGARSAPWVAKPAHYPSGPPGITKRVTPGLGGPMLARDRQQLRRQQLLAVRAGGVRDPPSVSAF
ncbi:MAG: hypothetical protein HYZ29_06220 [Myxococcales bacterium]|nr:hypothetical protein [Myxococcales bacterium]